MSKGTTCELCDRWFDIKDDKYFCSVYCKEQFKKIINCFGCDLEWEFCPNNSKQGE